MGAGFHGGFGTTEGFINARTDELITELQKKGVKFSKEKIVLITKDGTGQTVWLETGTPLSGLEHIAMRHTDDFKKKHGVDEKELVNHLASFLERGKVEYSRITKNGGYERLYSRKGQYFLLSGIGNNGYIVTAYPLDISTALRLIERYGR